MSNRSYDPHTTHRDLQSEFERLRIQALAGWNKELRVLERFGLHDGMSLLEVGSGPGFVTECLLRSLPNARITAVEIDPVLAEAAWTRLSEIAGDRLRIVTGSLLDSGLPNDHFDFALARLVFQHLPDPVVAAREILRLLSPGGHLAIVDSDDALWGLAEPPIPEMTAVLDDYGRAQAVRGGNRQIGRHLWRILEGAGFVGLEIEAILNHSDELGLATLLPHLDPDRLAPLVDNGLMADHMCQAFRESFAQFRAAPHPMLMMVMMAAHGRKPLAPLP